MTIQSGFCTLFLLPLQRLNSGKQIVQHGSQQAVPLVLAGKRRVTPYTGRGKTGKKGPDTFFAFSFDKSIRPLFTS
jgi:hypothetical protein